MTVPGAAPYKVSHSFNLRERSSECQTTLFDIWNYRLCVIYLSRSLSSAQYVRSVSVVALAWLFLTNRPKMCCVFLRSFYDFSLL